MRTGIRSAAFIIALVLTLPVTPYALSGFFVWLSPYMMLHSVLFAKGWVWFQVIAVAVLVGCVFYKRLFCRYLCPVGLLVDGISRITKKKSCGVTRKAPSMGVWLAVFALAGSLVGFPIFAVFDPVGYFNAFFSSLGRLEGVLYIATSSILPIILLLQFAFPGLWCYKVCPSGGVQDLAYKLKGIKQKPVGFSYSRRLVLSGGFGLLAGTCIPWVWASAPEKRLRPPSAIADDAYPYVCARCGNCVNSCPSKIIKLRRSIGDIRLWLTPEIDFSSGYCEAGCTHCGTVCPSGALLPFTVNHKKGLVIGKSKIDITNCLLRKQQECDQCVRSCPYKAISLTEGRSLFDVYPQIRHGKCVGCGACKAVCPEGCFSILHPSVIPQR